MRSRTRPAYRSNARSGDATLAHLILAVLTWPVAAFGIGSIIINF